MDIDGFVTKCLENRETIIIDIEEFKKFIDILCPADLRVVVTSSNQGLNSFYSAGTIFGRYFFYHGKSVIVWGSCKYCGTLEVPEEHCDSTLLCSKCFAPIY